MVFVSFWASITLTFLIVTLYSLTWISIKSCLGYLFEMRFIPHMAGFSEVRNKATYAECYALPCSLKDFFSFDSVVTWYHWIKLNAEDEEILKTRHPDLKVVAHNFDSSESFRVGTFDSFW